MIRANVALSRKITRDFNSTGYSVALDAEVGTIQDDPKAILEAVQRLYVLAEQAVDREIDRDQGEQAIGRRDEEPTRHDNGNRNGSTPTTRPEQAPPNQSNGRTQNGHDEAASNKQVQFLLSLGNRQGMSKQQVEGRIEQILGQRIDVYKLTKKEASRVIDALNQESPTNGRR